MHAALGPGSALRYGRDNTPVSRSPSPHLRRPRTVRLRWACMLPLLVLAVLLQSDAVVKSTVMNLLAFGEGAAAPCPMGMASMAGMSMDAPHALASGRRSPAKAPATHAPCSYCAAAAHTPILTAAALVQPSRAVAFTAFRTAAVHGPRGPPSVQPRARGPPLTA